jgi:hypothetical protein
LQPENIINSIVLIWQLLKKAHKEQDELCLKVENLFQHMALITNSRDGLSLQKA